MTNSKTTKRALKSSVLAIAMCVVMLIGTTFAWFTDTAYTAVNKVQSGKLDVVLEMKDSTGNWVSAEGETLKFKAADNRDEILWEPGCTYELPELRIRNNGNLALKYKVEINGINGDAKLNEVIDWYYSVDLSASIPGATGWTTPSDAYKLEDFGSEDYLYPAGTANNARTDSQIFKIVGVMDKTAGNEYQNLSIDGISITVVATQYTYENDINGNTYDQDAEYPTLPENVNYISAGVIDAGSNTYEITSAKGLKWLANQVNVEGNTFQNKTIKLTNDIDLNNENWTPIGNDYSTHFWCVFDGNGHTIKNLKVVESGRENNAQGYGFIGWANNTIKNVTFENATVEGHHNLGVIAGYQQFGKIVNCTVKNSTVTGTHTNDDLCGDKIGGIVGMCYNVQANGCDITNCKVENSTIKGGRDTGKIAGAACEFEGKFDGCTATGTTLGTTPGCTGANIGAQLGGLIGRDC